MKRATVRTRPHNPRKGDPVQIIETIHGDDMRRCLAGFIADRAARKQLVGVNDANLLADAEAVFELTGAVTIPVKVLQPGDCVRIVRA